MNHKVPFLSLIIPCYNERKLLKKVLEEVIAYLKKQQYSWEIIIVDDGSSDNTADIATGFKNRGVRLIKLSPNQGKGAALKKGFLNAKGKYVVFTDADLSVSITQLEQMIKKLQLGYPMVVGSRRIANSKIVVHQPLIREKMGKVFSLITKRIMGVSILDFTCGFKGFQNQAGYNIFKRSLINRWAYDAEIVFLAKKLKYKIGQIPVSWIDRRESRVRLGSAIYTSFFDLFRIRFNDILRKYD